MDQLAYNTTLKKMMPRLLGLCSISKQGSCHLILRTAMVSCQRHFCKINLKKMPTHRVSLNTMNNTDAVSESINKSEERYKEKNNLEKMITLDMYACRMKKGHCIGP